MTARAVMVCGTTSGAGKSFLATALARWYARRGFKVAPFKAQNMSNNARVAAGGEMGSAQYFQALAARAVPDVRMNPVLLKPEADTQSQVIVLGERRDDLSRMEWHARAREVWPIIRASLDELMGQHDVLVIEGAGSPAEINLKDSDVVNMRVAEATGAATLLICDIDRGGAFAHLYGTVQLLPPPHRALIRGFVLNKFRGDERLLAPAPQTLEELTGVPTLAVLPFWRDHGLPEEDGVFDARPTGAGLSVVVVAYPYISNLDEFAPLRRVPGLSLSWARQPENVAAADLLVLPGSKHVAADLAWLRERRLDAAIAAHISADKPTLAICGGLQMLGRAIEDPHGVEGSAQGLGLLPCSTEFSKAKRYRHGSYTFDDSSGFWEPLKGLEFTGYEIHHGATRLDANAQSGPAPRAVLPHGGGWQSGRLGARFIHRDTNPGAQGLGCRGATPGRGAHSRGVAGLGILRGPRRLAPLHGTAEGTRYLAPEIQLLYKARDVRPEDQADFERIAPRLDAAQMEWLREALSRLYPQHPWLPALAPNAAGRNGASGQVHDAFDEPPAERCDHTGQLNHAASGDAPVRSNDPER